MWTHYLCYGFLKLTKCCGMDLEGTNIMCVNGFIYCYAFKSYAVSCKMHFENAWIPNDQSMYVICVRRESVFGNCHKYKGDFVRFSRNVL